MRDTVTPPTRHSRRLSQSSSDVLICFSHLRWNFVYQRPQHLLGRAARDYRVVFFEEPLLRTGASIRLERYEADESVEVVTPVLPADATPDVALATQRDMVDFIAGEYGAIAVAWYYTPMALAFSRHLSPNVIVYDNMDELSGFRGASPALLGLERELFTRADIVFTGGQSLYLAKRTRHRNVHCFPSSIDVAHFRKARDGRVEPDDQASVTRPRLGFFGVIDERMDLGLVAALADLRPDWQFVMIGPVVKIDPAALPQRPNIHWLGGKSYQELPAYMAGWDVGIMPFALNEATRFISPTKTPEFLAASLPVVSTPITDVVEPYGTLGLVEIADTAAAFAAAAERLMRGQPPDWPSRVEKHLATNSWDQTWARMAALIRDEETPLGSDALAQTPSAGKGELRV